MIHYCAWRISSALHYNNDDIHYFLPYFFQHNLHNFPQDHAVQFRHGTVLFKDDIQFQILIFSNSNFNRSIKTMRFDSTMVGLHSTTIQIIIIYNRFDSISSITHLFFTLLFVLCRHAK
jgi:hypothetical protein